MNLTFTCKGEEAFVPLDLVLTIGSLLMGFGEKFYHFQGRATGVFPSSSSTRHHLWVQHLELLHSHLLPI